MTAALHSPKSISAKTREALEKLMLDIQLTEGGKVAWVAIYFDTKLEEHIAWYLPLRNLGGGLM